MFLFVNSICALIERTRGQPGGGSAQGRHRYCLFPLQVCLLKSIKIVSDRKDDRCIRCLCGGHATRHTQIRRWLFRAFTYLSPYVSDAADWSAHKLEWNLHLRYYFDKRCWLVCRDPICWCDLVVTRRRLAHLGYVGHPLCVCACLHTWNRRLRSKKKLWWHASPAKGKRDWSCCTDSAHSTGLTREYSPRLVSTCHQQSHQYLQFKIMNNYSNSNH